MLGKKVFSLIGVGVLVLLAGLFSNPRASIAADDVIKLGQVEALTGAIAHVGKQFSTAADFVIKEEKVSLE